MKITLALILVCLLLFPLLQKASEQSRDPGDPVGAGTTPAPGTEWNIGGKITAAGYTVRVIDQNGDPVPGAMVNVCSDTVCDPRMTDEEGCLFYESEPFNYHLQLLKAPEGYSFDRTQEYHTGTEYGETVITVTKN
ncbi:MAG: hypothetical protein IKH18_01770 [Clostridia bacterium]|nr:hypothetical protein [Clostridia bacterium]